MNRVWTVSYTHLDVYKRQVQIGAGAKAAGLVDPGGFQAVGKFLFPSFRFFFIHGGIAAV